MLSARLVRTVQGKKRGLKVRVGGIEREIARRLTPDMLGNSMHDLKAERDLIAAEIVNAKEPNSVALHPSAVAQYQADLNSLNESWRLEERWSRSRANAEIDGDHCAHGRTRASTRPAS